MQNVLEDRTSTVGAFVAHPYRPTNCLTPEAIAEISAARHFLQELVVVVVSKTANSLARLPVVDKSVPTSMVISMKSLMTIGDPEMSAVDTSEAAAAQQRRMKH